MTPFRCWQAGRLGSIAPGKAADLIAVAGDPLAEIALLRRVRAVIKNGTLVCADIVQCGNDAR